MERGILSVRTEYEYAALNAGLLNVLKEEAEKNKNKTKVVVCLFDIGEIYWSIKINVAFYKLPYIFRCPTELREVEIANSDYTKDELRKTVLSADYVIDKDADINTSYFVNRIGEIQKKVFEENKDQFKLISQLQMPDKSAVYVYKKVK